MTAAVNGNCQHRQFDGMEILFGDVGGHSSDHGALDNLSLADPSVLYVRQFNSLRHRS